MLTNNKNFNVKEKITDIIQYVSGYPRSHIEASDEPLKLKLALNNSVFARIIQSIRKEFDISEDDLTANSKLSIEDICNIINNKLGIITENPEAELDTNINPFITSNQINSEVKAIIQAKTGYPVDVLEEDLDLEADLGIDSVKQAEIFGQIREKFGYAANPDLNIKQFNTIARIVEYTISQLGTPPLSNIKNPIDPDKSLQQKINKFAGDNLSLRYVPVTIERKFDTSAGRVFSFRNKNFIIIEDRMGGMITKGLADKIVQNGGQACILSPLPEKYGGFGIHAAYDDLELFKAAIEKAKAKLTHVHGFIFLYPLIKDFSYFDCKDEHWYKEVDNSFNLLFYTARALYDNIEKHGLEAGCFAATSIGGIFGMEKHTSYNPAGALAAGFIKSLQKEFGAFSGKVVDLTDTTDYNSVSDLLFQEFSLIEQLIEIGYVNQKRKTICVVPHAINIDSVHQPLQLTPEDVVLVSGGGRGIVFESIKGLAEVYNPTIIITGRTALPNGNEEWLNMNDIQFEEYSKSFYLQMKAKNPKLTPIMIKQKLEKIKGAVELYNNMKQVKKSGYNISYIQCDVADRASVKRLAAEVSSSFGKVTGIIHGAGLPSFGKVPKKPEQHSLTVVQVKANGFFNLYREFCDNPLKFFASVGSISGRFGMDGQVDYAGGADLIARMSFQMFRKRPEIKCFVIGWTAWDEVGMAANPEVQKVQKEQRGLDYISAREGVYRFLYEMVYGGDYPEVLYFGSLGTNKPLGQMDILSENGKTIKSFFDKHGEVTNRIEYPLLQRITKISESGIEAEKDLYLDEDIYLKDHLVEGRYVYAGVMHLETYCQLGKMLNETYKKDKIMYATRLRDVEFIKFIKCFEDCPLTLRLKADVVKSDDTITEIRSEIISDFVNKKGMVLEKDRLHSVGYATFESKPLSPKKADVDVLEMIKNSKPMNIEKYYEYADKFISFGPTFRCLDYVGYISQDVVVGEITVPYDNEIFSYTALSDTIISPVSIDNLARFMLFIEYQKSGYTIIPKIIKDAVLYRPAKKGEKLYIHCKELRDEDKIVNFRAIAVDKDNNIVFDMVDLESIRIIKKEGEHNLL